MTTCEAPRPADALLATGPREVVAVRTADCVPVLLADPRSGLVAAIHAGWRGLELDVVGATIRRVVDRGIRTDDLIAAIGPAIGPNAFEIGPDVAARLTEAGLGSAVIPGDPRPHADLHLAARILLHDAGVGESRIDGHPICTHDDPRFFSYRRSGNRAGSHLAAIQAGTGLEVMRR